MSDSRDLMKKPVMGFLALVGALSLIFGLGALLTGVFEIQDTSPPELIGGLWSADSEEGAVLYFVTTTVMHELRVASYLPWEKATFRRYTLESRSLQDGSLRGQVVLADRYQRDQGSEILGIAGGKLWVWNGQLEIRDLNTLELVGDSETVSSANPGLAQVFPKESKFFQVSARLDALVVKGLDARYFTVAPENGKLNLLNDNQLDCALDRAKQLGRQGDMECERVWVGKAQFLFQAAESEGKGLWETTYNGYLHQNLREKKAWYALLSPEERSKLSVSDLNHQSRPYGDVARTFYRIPYSHNTQRNEWELNLDQVQVMNQTRFIKGGLLKRRNVLEKSDYTWRLDSPPSVIIVSKPNLAENSPWQLTRLSLKGDVIWSMSTGLVLIGEVLPGDQYLVIGGFEDVRGSQGIIPLRLATIEMDSGRLRMSTIESPQEP